MLRHTSTAVVPLLPGSFEHCYDTTMSKRDEERQPSGPCTIICAWAIRGQYYVSYVATKAPLQTVPRAITNKAGKRGGIWAHPYCAVSQCGCTGCWSSVPLPHTNKHCRDAAVLACPRHEPRAGRRRSYNVAGPADSRSPRVAAAGRTFTSTAVCHPC